MFKPESHQAYDQVTCDRKWANRRKNVRLVAHVVRLVAAIVGDRKGQISRSKVVVIFKTQSHRLTTRLRPTYDRKMLEWWANRRKNVRLVAEVVRLVAEVVGDRKGQISRNKVDGHVQNWSCHLTIGGIPPIHCSLTLYNEEIFLGFRSLPIRRPTLLIVRSIVRSIVYSYI